MIYRAVYMYSYFDFPRTKTSQTSKITLSLTASSSNGGPLQGKILAAIMPERTYKNMGYRNATGFLIPCCDEAGVKAAKCEPNKFVIPEKYMSNVKLEEIDLSRTNTVDLSSVIVNSGMYYVVAAVCDPSITPNTRLSGMMTAENVYGHLPATQYYSLPFFGWMSLAYLFTLVVWVMLCIQYSKEIMSVHLMILVVLISFVINSLVRVLYLWIYNSSGNDVFIYLSLFVDAVTRTLTRVLTLLVCMGLGISRATVSDVTVRVVIFAVVYFAVSLWDSLLAVRSDVPEMLNHVRVYVTAGLDALVYFWVFQSLMNTMDELRQNKQHAKLAVFVRLYSLLLVSVVVSTVTLIVFSYLVNNEDIPNTWRFQWFMNEGVWSLYYFLLFLCLMYMWRPTENSAAYAHHSELATDIQDEEEEYGLPQNKLETGEEGEVVVNPTTTDLKPMNITEGSAQA
ncbi:uncharacterized protein [Blastocystis hominis]|uniref:GOST seven transmembrane domain-containing protein n=1 Tax=Blastocystis hominis TaxID=12968 RepID=D8M6Q0_BLAHO|nr:uncharacterized protein [Blastocystis hominis]CBK23468.2 unnamed protein product [Blastocystis hominis]|eukprot:XP_012897516.1 uncharacterized protein [Blastocystis hominis]